MDNDKRALLEQRRQQLQIKMQAEAYIERHIKPARELFDDLHQHDLAYQIAGLVSTPAEYLPYVEQAMTQPPYCDYGFHPNHLQSAELEQLLDSVFDRFPSVNALRYVPDLPGYTDYGGIPFDNDRRDGLQKVMQALGLQDQNVYVHYLQYTLVLKVSLAALSNHEHESLFNTWHGEVLIFSDNPDWLITFTLEEEWLGGIGH